jgi:hypothetical protein
MAKISKRIALPRVTPRPRFWLLLEFPRAFAHTDPLWKTSGQDERGMDWKKLLESFTPSVDEELRLRTAYLAAENRVLRQQITGHIQLTDSDRSALAALGQKLGKKALTEIAVVAKPNTILAWRRTYADPQWESSQSPKAVGRPRIDKAIEDLVVRIARENGSWGYDRIVGALANLGYTVSDQTVGNILRRQRIPPAPERKKTTTWQEFIRIHMDVLGATDFFTSPVWSRVKLGLSFLLVFVHVGRHPKHLTALTASLTTWFAHWDAHVAPWICAVIGHVMSWLLGCGHAARGSRRAACASHDPHEDFPRSRGKVILLPVVNPRPIRDGPLRQRPWLSEMGSAEGRAAA